MEGEGFLEPARIVRNFGLKSGDHVADFGAGHGYFTIPLGQAVGPEGGVYAIDIQKPALDIIRSKARVLHLLNIEYIRADLDEPGSSGLQERFLDFVLIANALFQAEDREVLLREAWRVLRPGARMAMVEWDVAVPRLETAVADPGTADVAVPLGPPAAMRVKKETARMLATQAGFELDREFAAGPHHYGLLFVKK